MTTTTMTTSPSRVPIDCPRSIIAILGRCPPSSYIVAVGSERGQGTGSSSSSDSSDSDELLDEVEEEGGLGELTKSDSTSLNTDSHHRLPCYPVGTARCPPRTRRGPAREVHVIGRAQHSVCGDRRAITAGLKCKCAPNTPAPREYALREHVLRARMSRDCKNCFLFLPYRFKQHRHRIAT